MEAALVIERHEEHPAEGEMKGVRLADVTLDLGAGAGVVPLLEEGTLVLVSPIQIQES